MLPNTHPIADLLVLCIQYPSRGPVLVRGGVAVRNDPVVVNRPALVQMVLLINGYRLVCQQAVSITWLVVANAVSVWFAQFVLIPLTQAVRVIVRQDDSRSRLPFCRRPLCWCLFKGLPRLAVLLLPLIPARLHRSESHSRRATRHPRVSPFHFLPELGCLFREQLSKLFEKQLVWAGSCMLAVQALFVRCVQDLLRNVAAPDVLP